MRLVLPLLKGPMKGTRISKCSMSGAKVFDFAEVEITPLEEIAHSGQLVLEFCLQGKFHRIAPYVIKRRVSFGSSFMDDALSSRRRSCLARNTREASAGSANPPCKMAFFDTIGFQVWTSHDEFVERVQDAVPFDSISMITTSFTASPQPRSQRCRSSVSTTVAVIASPLVVGSTV